LEPIIQVVDAFTSVYEFLKDIKEIVEKSNKRGWKLFSSKKTETMERKFKEALMGTRDAIESSIWYGKGFAIAAECGSKVDKEFHQKLDEKLIDHLLGQLKVLEEYAGRFWNLQGIGNHPNKEKDALKIIEDFQSRLLDFRNSMEKYLRAELVEADK